MEGLQGDVEGVEVDLTGLKLSIVDRLGEQKLIADSLGNTVRLRFRKTMFARIVKLEKKKLS